MISVTVQMGDLRNVQSMTMAEFNAYPTKLSALNHLAKIAVVGAAHGVSAEAEHDESAEESTWHKGDPPTPGVYSTRNFKAEKYRKYYRYWSGCQWGPSRATILEAEEAFRTRIKVYPPKHPLEWELN